jgi:hypothetical protein
MINGLVLYVKRLDFCITFRRDENTNHKNKCPVDAYVLFRPVAVGL